ncbi:uncharacterized protein [Garra rufa]|uniref:uncharacterized protein isoform X2 n=1 Tax=Garra rufa TaxID=137080 RepID=UPI003CCEE818
MTKLQLLHRALNERLMAAVEQIMEMVGGTVLEYEEETIRARKENEVLRRRLRWMEGANRADWPGPSEPVSLSTTDETNPSQQDACAVNFGQESEGFVIKTESTELPLCATALPQSIDHGPDNAGTGTGVAYSLADSMPWDSAQSYMAPLDFDPTSGPNRARHWGGRNRRQRMSFACPDCGKVFGTEQRLIVHMRIHSTERPYAYRRRKACFYGDNKKKRKLHSLSQLSREIVDDLSDGSEQTNRSSASPEQLETRGREEEPESDHSSDREPGKRITKSVRNQRDAKKVVNQMCYCPHCPRRAFARPCQLAMHMKTHTDTDLVHPPTQAQSGTEAIVDVKSKLPKKQRKKGVKKVIVDGKSEFHCPDCDRVFSLASRLHFHMKSHTSKSALLCQNQPIKPKLEAVATTTEAQNLKEIKRPYACPHCDKVFAREGWLVPHIRTQHSEIKNQSDYFKIVYDSGRTRSQQTFAKRRIKLTERRKVTETPRLRNRKSKKARRRDKAKQPQTTDSSIQATFAGHLATITKDEAELSEDIPIMGIHEAEQSVDLPIMDTDEDEQSEDLPLMGTDEAEQSEDLPIMGTDEAEQSVDLSKMGTDEAQQSADRPEMGTEEAQRSADRPEMGTEEAQRSAERLEMGTDEAQQSAELLKAGTVESESISEQSKDTSGQRKEERKKKRFPCKTCGKSFVLEKRLKKHSRKHVGRKIHDVRKRKREQALLEMKLKDEEEKRRQESERLKAKMSTSNHNPNTTTPQGSPNKDSMQKSRTRGQGPLPCPFCGKVFAWEMRLLMHMQIHCGEKPYAYRQRKKRFYGDLKRGQLPTIHDQEPSGDKNDESEESEIEETVNKDGSAHLSSSETHAVPGNLASSTETTAAANFTGTPELLPQTSIEQPTTSYKSNQRTNPKMVSNIIHFNLQPRIVLQPIETKHKYWSSMPGVADLKSGCSEKRSGSDHGQTSHSIVVDEEIMDAVQDKIVDSKLCTLPVEFSGHGIQNTGDLETEIISDVELDNTDDPLAIESSGKNTEGQQKDDHNFNFPCVSEKKARNQGSLIVIDDELEESNARNAAKNALSECGRTKCDCNNISAMKLTVMPQSSVLDSLFKKTSSDTMQKNIDSKLVCVVLSDVEDNVDEDLLGPFKSLDKKYTASVPSIQNEQLDVGSKPGKTFSSDSNLSFPDATKSTKSIDIDDQSISYDQMASTTIRQTKDRLMSSKERTSHETSDMIFAGQEPLSEVNADMEIVSGSERQNKKLDLNNQHSKCQTNSTDDNSSVLHHCFYCKQPHYRMMDHLQSVHYNELEVAKALTFDKSSQERKQILNLLQTRGNILDNTNVVQSSKQDLKPLGKFSPFCSFEGSVCCIFCLGLFNKKAFASHLEQCKSKSTQSAEASCGEMLPNAGPIPPTPTLISSSCPAEIDASIEPSGFHCLNTTYQSEQGQSSLLELSCNVEQPAISSPNVEVGNNRQAEGAILQFIHSTESKTGYELKSGNSPNPSTCQESTHCKNEGVSLPKCDVAQERAMTLTSDTSSTGPYQEYDVLRNPSDDFSPPQNVSSDKCKSGIKDRNYGTGKMRRKGHFGVGNRPPIMDNDQLGEGEISNSKRYVCQRCKAAFASSYTLRRHEYTHTGERPFWCNQCNLGFIQKYRLLKHTLACHGDTSSSADQEKLKSAKRTIQDGETSVTDEACIQTSSNTSENLPNAVTDDTGEQVADTRQDTEVREFHWEEAGHSKVKDNDTDF